MARFIKVEGVEKDVVAELGALGVDPASLRAKVVLVGNPGVGKSALISALLGDPDAVLHAVRAKRVTTDVTRVVLRGTQGCGHVLLYDIPGLVEAGETNLARNKACLQKAMTELPDLPTVVICVATVAGGRPQQGCMQGMTTVLEYLTGDRAEDVDAFPDVAVCVVNQVPHESRAAAAIAALHDDVVAEVRTAVKLDPAARVECLPRVNNGDMYDAGSAGFTLVGERMRALLARELGTARVFRIPPERALTLPRERDAATKQWMRTEREEAEKARDHWKALAVVATGVVGTAGVCYACAPVILAFAAV